MNQRPILIQGAMIIELKKIIGSLNNLVEEKIGSWSFYIGTHFNYPIIVSKTEMGMVNASAATALAIEKYNPLAIINQGSAGAHSRDLNKYDIVIGTSVINIGSYRSDFKEAGEGFHAKDWIPLKTSVVIDGRVKRVSSFPCDDLLIKSAKDSIPLYSKGNVVEGVLASADEWNKELDRLNHLNLQFKTLSEDMESAACSQIALSYKIPFLGIRIISNNEHKKDSFAKDSCEYSQEFTLNTVKNYIDNLKC